MRFLASLAFALMIAGCVQSPPAALPQGATHLAAAPLAPPPSTAQASVVVPVASAAPTQPPQPAPHAGSPPALSDVGVSGITSAAAHAWWTVSSSERSVTSWALYGTDPERLTLQSATATGPGPHTEALQGLTAGVWYFQVVAADSSGTTHSSTQSFGASNPPSSSPETSPGPSATSDPPTNGTQVNQAGGNGGNETGSSGNQTAGTGTGGATNQTANGACPETHPNMNVTWVNIQNRVFNKENVTICLQDWVAWKMMDAGYGCALRSVADSGLSSVALTTNGTSVYRYEFTVKGTYDVECRGKSFTGYVKVQ
ncbi:MAG: cupredoxin domain-containing protein [Thermoplasmatota archaeon]